MDEFQESLLNHLERLGHIIYQDDEKDFLDPARRFSFAGHPSPLHHWQVGMAMISGAQLLRTVAELSSLMEILAPATAAHPLEADLARLQGGL